MKLRASLAVFVVSCAATSEPVHTPLASLSYADDVKWICVPGAAFDACKTELVATELLADGTRKEEPHVAARDPKVDCFYVYPTVDLDLVPGNHDDFDDTRKQRDTTLAQVGRFTEACAVWAPLYRQVTIGTYLRSRERLERGLAIAFSDVDAAFREFLSRVPADHKIVVVGHSQGAEMVVRVVKKFFDHDDAMRARLLLAMPIGGDVEVATGKTTGGTFDTIPICTQPKETGCVVTYRSFSANAPVNPEGRWVAVAGRAGACVNPATIDGGTGRFSHAYFPLGGLRRFMRGVDGITTAYVDLPDFYSGKCVTDPSGFSYLAIDDTPPAGDRRVSVLDLRKPMGPAKMGLHLVDMQIEQGDLVAMIARRTNVAGSSEAR